MKQLIHSQHPFRIFFVSAAVTLLSLVGVYHYLGVQAMFVAFVLVLVEITFSFENAIINAKILSTMSPFWQRMFMTVGIMIAVIGMRLVFPIVIVVATSGLSAGHVIDLALHNPVEYSHKLHDAHASIAAFGGMFLMMLCLNFFFDTKRDVMWVDIIEKPLKDMSRWWLYSALSLVVLLIVTVLPMNPHPKDTFTAGLIGIVTYIAINWLADLFTKHQEDGKKAGAAIMKTGMAGLMSFLYLEVLDASFSFDGVIGAFAVTKDVVVIAIGLGIGALWVRSLTIFMVRRHILGAYRYLEHGAHYTIGVLSIVLICGIFFDIPEIIAGVAGLCIVGMSIASSVAEQKRDEAHV